MRFIVAGTKYEFDERKLTFAEARTMEKVMGRPMSEFGTGDAMGMQAMVWVAMKRQDPNLRFSDLDDMPMGDVEFLEDEPVEAPDPTQPTLDAVDEGISTPSE